MPTNAPGQVRRRSAGTAALTPSTSMMAPRTVGNQPVADADASRKPGTKSGYGETRARVAAATASAAAASAALGPGSCGRDARGAASSVGSGPAAGSGSAAGSGPAAGSGSAVGSR